MDKQHRYKTSFCLAFAAVLIGIIFSNSNSQISVGIGLDYGRALMVKAGYTNSELNDVIWMGDVVNSACHIANKAGRNGEYPILVSGSIYSNLYEKNQNFLHKTFIDFETYYGGDVINLKMDEWYEENYKN